MREDTIIVNLILFLGLVSSFVAHIVLLITYELTSEEDKKVESMFATSLILFTFLLLNINLYFI